MGYHIEISVIQPLKLIEHLHLLCSSHYAEVMVITKQSVENILW